MPIWEEHLAVLGASHRDGFSAGVFDIELLRADEVNSQVDGEEWVAGRRFKLVVMKQELPVITPAEWEAPWKRS